MASPQQLRVSPFPIVHRGASPAPGSRRGDAHTPTPGFAHVEHTGSANTMTRTKIVVTLGPACDATEASLAEVIRAGMHVARVSMATYSQEAAARVIQRLRAAARSCKRLVAVLLDLRGPEVRLLGSSRVKLETGAKVAVAYSAAGQGESTPELLLVDRPQLLAAAAPGGKICLEDGLVELEVEAVDGDQIRCAVVRGGKVTSRTSVAMPGARLDLPLLTEDDERDVAFAAAQGVHFVTVPLARSREGVEAVRRLLPQGDGAGVRVVAKVKSREGVENFDGILAAADAVIFSRGGLGVDVELEQVAILQKDLAHRCNSVGKPFITSSQMLESMIENPSPTRAEVSDVGNAVFDGTDAVMLTGETGRGKYPLASVQYLADILREAETFAIDFTRHVDLARSEDEALPINEAVASSAVQAARDIRAALMIVLTQGGSTARLVSKYRPNVPILTVTADECVASQLLMLRACVPMLVTSMSGSDSLIDRIVKTARDLGMCRAGDAVVITRGTDENVRGGTNMLKIARVPGA